MAFNNILEFFAGGFERCQAGTIDSEGYFTGSTGTPATLTGSGMIQLQGANVANMPAPSARSITPEGDDGKVGTIMLPSIETLQFTLTLSVMNATFAALVQGTLVHAIEEYSFVDVDPDNPTYRTMCLLFSRKAQSKVAATPGSGYEHLLLPNCQVSWDGPGQFQTGTNAAGYNYSVTVDRASKYPWGLAYSLTNNGTTSSSGKTFTSENRFTMHAFTGDNSDTSVVTDYTPVSTTLNTNNFAYVNGTKETTGITISGKTWTWGAAPAAAAKVVIGYEHTMA